VGQKHPRPTRAKKWTGHGLPSPKASAAYDIESFGEVQYYYVYLLLQSQLDIKSCIVIGSCDLQECCAWKPYWAGFTELGTRVRDSRLESLFLRLETYLRPALKDLRLDLWLEHKDLRLTRDSTLKTLGFLQVLMLLTSRHKDELGNISTWRYFQFLVI